MAHIPMFKLGGLVLKQLAKPLAARIKVSAAEHPYFRRSCVVLGRAINDLTVRANVYLLGHKPVKVKELSESAAVIRGADVLGEVVVLGVGVAVLAYEVMRGAADKAKSEAKAKAEKEQAERKRDLRFEELEDAIRLLQSQLQEKK